jgi:3-methyladenine DNA glycosylase Tag
VFETGQSWSIVFGKREAFRRALRGFDVAQVAAMTARDVDQLTQDASIIRNRGKIQATVDNARHGIRIAKLGHVDEVVPDQPRARTPVHRRRSPVDAAGGGVREAAEVSGVASCSVCREYP